MTEIVLIAGDLFSSCKIKFEGLLEASEVYAYYSEY